MQPVIECPGCLDVLPMCDFVRFLLALYNLKNKTMSCDKAYISFVTALVSHLHKIDIEFLIAIMALTK